MKIATFLLLVFAVHNGDQIDTGFFEYSCSQDEQFKKCVSECPRPGDPICAATCKRQTCLMECERCTCRHPDEFTVECMPEAPSIHLTETKYNLSENEIIEMP